MRSRYQPLAIPTIQASSFVFKTKDEFLDWIKEQSKPIHLEIGCGKGQFLIESATRNPDVRYIGIELEPNVLYRALEKIENQEIENLRFIWGDADEWLSEFRGPVEQLYLQFSDPWPKVRHEKRRLTTLSRLSHYASFVQGRVFFKTDDVEFYQYSLSQFEASVFQVVAHGILPLNETGIMTEFETKYRQLGNLIYTIEAKR